MGLDITRETFDDSEFELYSSRLYQCLDVLKQVIRKPGFGMGPKTIGAELENYIVDSQGLVLPLNEQIINKSNDKHFTVELNQFNLEINFEPEQVAGGSFSRLQAQRPWLTNLAEWSVFSLARMSALTSRFS